MVALCLPKDVYMAREMYDAINGLGTNEGTLVEILCSGTNHEIRDMNTAYVRCKLIFLIWSRLFVRQVIYSRLISVRPSNGEGY